MIAGRFAFQGLSDYLTWQKVKALEYTFPEGFDDDAKDLVQKLLVRDPLERLGCGEPGAPNDMAALKSHTFFSVIDWSTLWTIPAPPLEPGLVKKERNPLSAGAVDGNWDDIGTTWEDMVGMPRGSDGIPWAGDEDEYDDDDDDNRTENGLDTSVIALPSTQPDPEIATSCVSNDKPTEDTDGTAVVRPSLIERPSSKPIGVPAAAKPADAVPMGSTTSSSEGSPIEKFGAALEAALNRGRNRVQTPIQGNASPPNWYDMYLWHDYWLIDRLLGHQYYCPESRSYSIHPLTPPL